MLKKLFASQNWQAIRTEAHRALDQLSGQKSEIQKLTSDLAQQDGELADFAVAAIASREKIAKLEGQVTEYVRALDEGRTLSAQQIDIIASFARAKEDLAHQLERAQKENEEFFQDVVKQAFANASPASQGFVDFGARPQWQAQWQGPQPMQFENAGPSPFPSAPPPAYSQWAAQQPIYNNPFGQAPFVPQNAGQAQAQTINIQVLPTPAPAPIATPAPAPVAPAPAPAPYVNPADAKKKELLAKLERQKAEKLKETQEQADLQKAKIASIESLTSSKAIQDQLQREKERNEAIEYTLTLKSRWENDYVAMHVLDLATKRGDTEAVIKRTMKPADVKKLLDEQFPIPPNYNSIRAFYNVTAGKEIWDADFGKLVGDAQAKAISLGANIKDVRMPDNYVPSILADFEFAEGKGVAGAITPQYKMQIAHITGTAGTSVDVEKDSPKKAPATVAQPTRTQSTRVPTPPKERASSPELDESEMELQLEEPVLYSGIDGSKLTLNPREVTVDGALARTAKSVQNQDLQVGTYRYTRVYDGNPRDVYTVYAPERYNNSGVPQFRTAEGRLSNKPGDAPDGFFGERPFWIYGDNQDRVTFCQPRAFDPINRKLIWPKVLGRAHGATDVPPDFDKPGTRLRDPALTLDQRQAKEQAAKAATRFEQGHVVRDGSDSPQMQ